MKWILCLLHKRYKNISRYYIAIAYCILTIINMSAEICHSNMLLHDEDTPIVPRGKRSDVTESDRLTFVSSFGDLLKLLDEIDDNQHKGEIGEDIIENIINA